MAKVTSLILNKINELFNIGIFYVFPRPSIRFIRDRFKGKNLIGAEIGVAGGENVRSMLKTLNLSRLYLIDPYTLYGNDYLDGIKRK